MAILNGMTTDVDAYAVQAYGYEGDYACYNAMVAVFGQNIRIMPGVQSDIGELMSVKSRNYETWIRPKYEVKFFAANGDPKSVSETEQKKAVKISHDTANWTLEDCWWYYNTALRNP